MFVNKIIELISDLGNFTFHNTGKFETSERKICNACLELSARIPNNENQLFRNKENLFKVMAELEKGSNTITTRGLLELCNEGQADIAEFNLRTRSFAEHISDNNSEISKGQKDCFKKIQAEFSAYFVRRSEIDNEFLSPFPTKEGLIRELSSQKTLFENLKPLLLDFRVETEMSINRR